MRCRAEYLRKKAGALQGAKLSFAIVFRGDPAYSSPAIPSEARKSGQGDRGGSIILSRRRRRKWSSSGTPRQGEGRERSIQAEDEQCSAVSASRQLRRFVDRSRKAGIWEE
ncbi:hypothetical protein R1flu_006942 [Riccia fluitans]|uniref:Uncharacterized protein n=1 Tax=Riccia fluitans TaxID=41844 RepID=A0ABD1YXF4_9MARC